MLQQLCLWALGKTASGLLISDVIIFVYVLISLFTKKKNRCYSGSVYVIC